MLYLSYDGSFDGLLTAIYAAYYNYNKYQDIEIVAPDEIPALFTEYSTAIKTDESKSSRVYNAIKTKLGRTVLSTIYYTYLSELPLSSQTIFQYIQAAFKTGPEINRYLHLDCVRDIQQIARKVSFERHRLLGLLRFTMVDTFLYAKLEPDHNIIALLAPHFSKRLSQERWLIHDCKRHIAVVYKPSDWILTEIDNHFIERLSAIAGDNIYEHLWKSYFNAATINNRINIKNQTRLMPKRYWKYLPEVSCD